MTTSTINIIVVCIFLLIMACIENDNKKKR